MVNDKIQIVYYIYYEICNKNVLYYINFVINLVRLWILILSEFDIKYYYEYASKHFQRLRVEKLTLI